MTLYGVYGAGGCGRGILPIARAQVGAKDRLVFVDDNAAGHVNGAEVMSLADFAAESSPGKQLVLAIAGGRTRRELAEKSAAANISFFTIRHATMVQMDDVIIGEGALFSPFTTVTSNVRIGKHFHCNLYSYVEHDCVIGDFVTFAPGVKCNGNVIIGDGAYIGAGAVIRQGLTIGAGSTVGMGAIVTKDIPDGETWVGNPARRLDR